jgi:hypothetical protein
MYGIVCDTALARNGTSPGPPSYGLPDANDSQCQLGCRGAITEACGGPGNNSANTQRLSLYQFTVSGFRDNAYVLKLKVLYLLLSFCSRLARLNDTRTVWNEGYGNREGPEVHWGDGVGQYRRRGSHFAGRENLNTKIERRSLWSSCDHGRHSITVYLRVKT